MRFFLIDKVTEIVPGERARGVKAVTLTDEVLHDHFPDYPLLPGTLLVEAMAQLGGYLLEATAHRDAGGVGPVQRAILSQINGAKFYEPAGPGDRLEIEVTPGSSLGGAAQVNASASRDGQKIARAQLTFVLRSVDSDRVHEQRRALYRLWTRGLGGQAPIP